MANTKTSDMQRFALSDSLSEAGGRAMDAWSDVACQGAATCEVAAKFDAFVQYSAYGYCELDPSGLVLAANRRISEIVGCSAEELVGRHFSEFLDPPQRAQAEADFQKALMEPVKGPREYWIGVPGGRRRLVTVISVPLMAPTCPRKLLLLILDLTDRIQTEDAALETATRYCKLLTSISSYTYTVRMEGGVPVKTDHSPACLAVTGYSPEDYLANRYLWIDMVHPDDRDAVREYVARILSGEDAPPIEHRIIRRDGVLRWLRDTIVPHRQNGEMIGYDGLVEDVTDRKEAEVALQKTETDLRAAQRIQARLLPNAPPNIPGFDIAGASYPASFTGGDYFDYLPLGGGRLGVVIGDVSGHGLGPALVMALVYAHLKSLVQDFQNPSEVLSAVNRFLASETDRFVTMFFGQLDPLARSFAYASAGHPACYVLDAAGDVKAELPSTAVPLAIMPDAQFPPGRAVDLEPGDVVFLLTDGVIEAESPAGNLFGIQGALDVVRRNLRQDATGIIERLHSAVREFSCPLPQDDDVTAVVIKVLRTSEQTGRAGIG